MSVSQHDWSLHRKGQIDQERHKEKIREAVKKNLGDIVSEESIILSDGKKTVRVPIRSLDEYRFRYDPGRQQHAGHHELRPGGFHGQEHGRPDGEPVRDGEEPHVGSQDAGVDAHPVAV